MKKLEEHNDGEIALFIAAQTISNRQMAGVLCDVCDTEMYYTHPNQVLESNPPKMEVKCPQCGNSGCKIV